MHRSPIAPSAAPQIVTSDSKFDWFDTSELLRWDDRDSVYTAHSLFAPIHYERGYAYPLIVWLHGAQGNENELRQVMPHISMRNHVGAAPRGTVAIGDSPGAFDWDQSAEGIYEAAQSVDDCIDIAQRRFNINPQRIFLVGKDSGGTMAFRLGKQHPNRFAGAISLGGAMPQGLRPLREINAARSLPLMLSVSPDPTDYPVERVMQDLRLMHYAGFSLSLRLYPDGNDLTTNMLADVDSWILEQFCPTTLEASK